MSKKKINIQKVVMGKIKKEQVKMKPKLYFVGGSIMVGVGLTALVLSSSLIVDGISFRLSSLHAREMANFGWWGWKMVMRVVPWNLVLLASILVGLGVKLIKRYEFSYKKGLVWVVTGMILGVMGLSFLMGRLDMKRRLPVAPVRKLYETKELPPRIREEMIERGWKQGEVKGLMRQTPRR